MSERVPDVEPTVVAVAVGVASLLAAVAVVTGVGADPIAGVLGPLLGGSTWTVSLLATAAIVVAAASLVDRRDDGATDVALPDPPADTDGSDLVGGEGFGLFGGVRFSVAVKRDWHHDGVKRQIESLALEVLTDAGYDREAAGEALAAGTWTDDPRAAAYLGEDVTLPFGVRVLDWASGEGYERQVEATIDELGEVTGVETEVSER